MGGYGQTDVLREGKVPHGLELRAELKAQIKKKNLEKQGATTFGSTDMSQSQTNRVVNDDFGSFFGPSKPSISKRVIEQISAMRETQHVRSSGQKSSTTNKTSLVSKPSDTRANEINQKPIHFNDVKAKIQALKELRDYSFLLGDDDDNDPSVPTREKFEGPPHSSLSKSGMLSNEHNSKNKLQPNKPASASIGHNLKSSSAPTNQLKQSRAASANGVPTVRPKMASTVSTSKTPSGSLGNGRVKLPPAHKNLPSRNAPVASTTSKSTMNSARDLSTVKRPSMLKPHSSAQVKAPINPHPSAPMKYPEQMKPSMLKPQHSSTQVKPAVKASINPHLLAPKKYPEQKNALHRPTSQVKPAVKPQHSSDTCLSSSKPQPPKKMAPNNGVQLKKRPAQWDYDNYYEDDDDEEDEVEDEDEDGNNALMEIRKMFNYDPRKYKSSKYDDDRDMEVSYDKIMLEERESERIAMMEDEEELRLIQLEEERVRKAKIRKKQRMQ